MITPDYKEVAAQLRKPTGSDGLKTAERMADNNGYMISQSIDKLDICDYDRIMEIGHGGGMHVTSIINKANNICYKGVDISPTMIDLATNNNQLLVNTGEVSFTLAESINGYVTFPFEDDVFDKIFTVNTIYFWDNAAAQARDIARVLKKSGLFLLCFADESFMKNMPFTQYDFQLYKVADAAQLLVSAGFRIESIESEDENITGFHGEKFERKVHFIRAVKL